MNESVTKRLMDIVLAGLLLVMLSPVIAIVAILVRLVLGSPVLFAQQRPGRCEQAFRLYKFRSMSDASNASGELLPDSERLGRSGQFLRRTSIDEWPTLWNVLKGDMSLVGPRPLLMEYLDHYSNEQARRHDVRPGITGWAQVNGRNALTWQDKFVLDVWYVDHWSLGFDIKILFMTIRQIFSGHGVSHPGEATMTRFRGND